MSFNGVSLIQNVSEHIFKTEMGADLVGYRGRKTDTKLIGICFLFVAVMRFPYLNNVELTMRGRSTFCILRELLTHYKV